MWPKSCAILYQTSLIVTCLLQFCRLQHALNVTTLNDILDVNLLSWKNAMDNITSDLRSGMCLLSVIC